MILDLVNWVFCMLVITGVMWVMVHFSTRWFKPWLWRRR